MNKHLHNILVGGGLVALAALYSGILFYPLGRYVKQLPNTISFIVIMGPLFVLVFFAHKFTYAGVKPYGILAKLCSYIFPALVGFSFAQLLLKIWPIDDVAHSIGMHVELAQDWVQLIFIFVGMLVVEIYRTKKKNREKS